MITYKASIDKQSKIKNALKRTSKFRNVSRELPGGVRQQRHGTELISKQLAETKGVGGAGAWPLTDRRVSTYVRTCREPIFG
jgi:hypothetical protein